MGHAIPTIRVEGALTKSHVWMQLKAEVTGRRVEGVQIEEATALGAALLAGVGSGVYSDCGAVADAVTRELEPWVPTPELAATYSVVFERGFRCLPRLIADITPALERPQGETDEGAST